LAGKNLSWPRVVIALVARTTSTGISLALGGGGSYFLVTLGLDPGICRSGLKAANFGYVRVPDSRGSSPRMTKGARRRSKQICLGIYADLR
jgi:hypothetical protein